MCGTRKPCPRVQRKLSLNKMKNSDNSKQRLLTEGNWLLGKRENPFQGFCFHFNLRFP